MSLTVLKLQRILTFAKPSPNKIPESADRAIETILSYSLVINVMDNPTPKPTITRFKKSTTSPHEDG